jgi:hypothetical protein
MQELRKCTRCKLIRPIAEFNRSNTQKAGYQIYCRDCKAEYKRAWWKKNPEKGREGRRKNYAKNRENEIAVVIRRNRQLRREAMDAYGGPVCACCGEAEERFLAIDHMNNDGFKYPKSVRSGLCKWLKQEGYPPGYQVLCHNCNLGKHLNGGICPHEYYLREQGDVKIKPKLDIQFLQ